MIAATRRQALVGAAAFPALAGLPRFEPAGAHLLLHDPALAAGRRLAQGYPGEAVAIEGDRVRLARALFARRPALVLGISRPADALLIGEVAGEAGYRAVPEEERRLRALIDEAGTADRGLVLGWVLAPRS